MTVKTSAIIASLLSIACFTTSAHAATVYKGIPDFDAVITYSASDVKDLFGNVVTICCFFTPGDGIKETYTDIGLSSIDRIAFDLPLFDGLNANTQLDFNVLLNDNVVGNFHVADGPVESIFSFDQAFAPVSAINGNYVFEFRQTNQLPDGSGSIGLYEGTSIAFSQGAVAVPEVSTWTLMILGFGITGAMMRTRSKAAMHSVKHLIDA